MHFETPDSGFFLKHSPRQSQSTVAAVATDVVNNPAKPAAVDQSSILSVDRFTIVQTTQPVSIRASYGPFSTKQTVPARFIVPDAMEAQGDHLQVRFQLFTLHNNAHILHIILKSNHFSNIRMLAQRYLNCNSPMFI